MAPKSTWEEVRNLIEIIEGYPILYTKRKSSMIRAQFLQARSCAWEEVAFKTNWTALKCKFKFNDLKCKYIILKNMIGSGDLTEELIRERPELSNLLDGVFDFIDPYIHDIPYWRLRSTKANRFYKELLAASSKRKLRATSEIENEVIDEEDNFEHDIFSEETNLQPPSILPTNEYEESVHIYNETMFDSTIQNNTTNEETEEFILSDLNVPMKDDNHVTDLTPIQMFLMKYSDDNEDGFDIKQYFNELAELLCEQLVLEKRQNFLNHVDLLVSEILEG